MRDPAEGVDQSGCIVTGVRRDRIPLDFEPIIDAAIEAVSSTNAAPCSLYLYGSVATGAARSPRSDVDLLTIGVDEQMASALSHRLSDEFHDRCRAVDVGVAQLADLEGDDDRAYGNRVFLRHYCIHLCGPVVRPGLPAFPADRRAARGFNGDIEIQARRWRSELDRGVEPSELARRIARKSLLAVSGLVSIHDGTWTTDRAWAARRWSQVEPALARELERLMSWSESPVRTDAPHVRSALDGIVADLIASFEATIGLWPTT
jgi:uncharacterized protein